MKVYISADIEGVGCVCRPEHSRIDGRDYALARQLMTGEVNAAIAGAFAGGATQLVVVDSHNVGLNLYPEELDERAELIMGMPRPLAMMEGVDQGFDAAFFIGYHAKPGSADGLIAHNFHSRIRDLFINNVSVGELGLNAALAGLYNVPMALLSGDAVTVAEGLQLMPWLECVTVKRGIGAYAAQCLHPKVCRERIFEGARRALQDLPRMRAFKVQEPLCMEVHCTTASSADRLAKIPGVQRVAPMVLKMEGVDLRTAFDVFITMEELVDMVPFI